MCFGRPCDIGLDAGRLELGAELGHRPVDVGLAALAPRVEELGELAEAFGLEGLEREVLQLPLDLPDPEALGQRRVDLHGLAGDALLLLGRQAVQGAHVVEPVGELDEDDPDVLGHREEHLADVLGLLLLVAVGGEPRQLGHAVDEVGDLGAEALLDVGQAVLGVLGDVVEERRLDGDRVDPELGEDLGTRDRMRDVRLAGRPFLARVRLDREVERAVDAVEVGVGVMLDDRRLERRPQDLEVDLAARGRPRDRRSATRSASRRAIVRIRPRDAGRDSGGFDRGGLAVVVSCSPWAARIAAGPFGPEVVRLSRGWVRRGTPCAARVASATARSSQGTAPSGPMIERSWPLPASRTMSPGRAASNAAAIASPPVGDEQQVVAASPAGGLGPDARSRRG